VVAAFVSTVDDAMGFVFSSEVKDINIDMRLETPEGVTYFEYDGVWYHRDKYDEDTYKTQLLVDSGAKVLRVIDRLCAIQLEGCTCIIIDRSKSKEEDIARYVYRHLPNSQNVDDDAWKGIWLKVKSLADRAINHYLDKQQRTLQQVGLT
jgi:hypothetical protein